MDDLSIRKDRRAGRITLTRPQALNALDHDMVRAIATALRAWRDDPDIALVIIDAEGARAFCAGGDIAALWQAAKTGDHEVGRTFFADEYRMNAQIARYPKPVVAFMQGFVMGGGVGLGGHASVRIVGDTTQMAMPESGIGMIPDVGGTWLLARAPGRIGEYLGLTGARMDGGDAIHAGFADRYLPETEWPSAIEALAESGDLTSIPRCRAPEAGLETRDLCAFGGGSVPDILAALEAAQDTEPLDAMRRNSPLSMAATLAMVRAARGDTSIKQSLSREHRFTHRATADSDFMEGVRAQLIDKDRAPRWTAPADRTKVEAMLAPLGTAELRWDMAEGRE